MRRLRINLKWISLWNNPKSKCCYSVFHPFFHYFLFFFVGAGESGKSTIIKQMKLLHDNGYSEEERYSSLPFIFIKFRMSFKEVVFANAIQCMKVVVDAMLKLGIFYGEADNEKHRDVINHLPYRLEAPVMPREAYAAIKGFDSLIYDNYLALWADSGIQLCVSRSNEYQLSDSAK